MKIFVYSLILISLSASAEPRLEIVPDSSELVCSSVGSGEEPLAFFAANDCCKVCKKGKACGDTCIAKNKICHEGPGCACDAE